MLKAAGRQALLLHSKSDSSLTPQLTNEKLLAYQLFQGTNPRYGVKEI